MSPTGYLSTRERADILHVGRRFGKQKSGKSPQCRQKSDGGGRLTSCVLFRGKTTEVIIGLAEF